MSELKIDLLNWNEQSTTKSVFMTVTPELAQEWLSRTPVNRKLNKREVLQIEEDIRNGEWNCEGHEIMIGRENEVVDGNHRLTAVVNAGIPIKMHVRFGCVPSRKIDIGMRRTARQSLIMSRAIDTDHPLNKPCIVSMINCAIYYGDANTRATSDDVLKYYEAAQREIDVINEMITSFKFASTIITVPMLSALQSGVDAEVLKEWYHIMESGVYDETTLRTTACAKSVLHARNLILNTRGTQPRHIAAAVRSKDQAMRIMSSIYHFDRNEAISKLCPRDDYKVHGLHHSIRLGGGNS